MIKRWAVGVAAIVGAMGGAIGVAAPAANAASDLEFYTGESLYAQCQPRPGEADYQTHALRCAGYVLGVSDAQQARQGAGQPGRVCLPGTATATDVVSKVSAYLIAHPEKRPLAAQDLVIEALAAAYPCR
ncbi:MAG TPA: Rap1a/Tai family immunity protein [Caulobacteraceae bacterium]|nr:Rap1a/Tai family immunity protein [Caulobacteraceae bacterium]